MTFVPKDGGYTPPMFDLNPQGEVVIEFKPFDKIARLYRDIVITEKIDGTNGAVQIVKQSFGASIEHENHGHAIAFSEELDDSGFPMFEYVVAAQSRNRLLPDTGDDNYGFRNWVHTNAEALVKVLGEGVHYGEWWGSGIQRGYGLTNGDKRFSLFNTARWGGADLSAVDGLGVVPSLYEGPFSILAIEDTLYALKRYGSAAAEGFDRPEGVVIYHKASGDLFKVTLENDGQPKGAAA